MMAVILLTTYSALFAGVRIWKRVESSVREVDLTLGWKKFRKDLVGVIPFKAIGFSGAPREVSFPGLVAVKGADDLTHEEVGRVRYLFEGTRHLLCREETTYVDLVRGAVPVCKPVVSSVGSASFEYYVLEGAPGSGGSWVAEWRGKTPPLAVRLKIALEGGGGVEKQFTATLP